MTRLPPVRPTCGTVAAYRRHLAHGEVPCQHCCDAQARQRARERSRHRAVQPRLYAAALAGDEPAEVLTMADRHRLVGLLHRWGWSDVDIAIHTRMTTFTTAEIRAGLGLHPHPVLWAEDLGGAA